MKAVNLLPSDTRSPGKTAAAPGAPAPQRAGGAGPFVVLGVLAAAVACTAAYVLAGNTVKDREAELVRVTADQQRVVAQAAALKPYADFQALAGARVETVQQLAGARFDWEQALRDLSKALPEDVRLTALNASTGAPSGQPAAANAPAVSPSIQIQGCADSQTNVARLMSRLRTIRGVASVSLTKSDKGSSSGSAVPTQVTASGEAKPSELCKLKRNPPTFDLTMFFEGGVPGVTPQAGTAGAAPAPNASPAPGAAASPQASTGATNTTASAPGTPGATTQNATATQGASK